MIVDPRPSIKACCGARELVGRRPINAGVNMPGAGFRVAREMPRVLK